MKRILYRILWVLQIHHLARFFLRNKTIILVYHGLTDRDTHEGVENYDAKHLHVKRFQTQMEYLKKYYRILPLDSWLEKKSKGEPIPDRTVILTFDDGYRSNYTLAYPLLKRLHIPATIFLTTDFVENKRFLWTDRVEYALQNTDATLDRESKIQSAMSTKLRLKARAQESRDKDVGDFEVKSGKKLSEDREPPEIYRPLEWGDVSEMLKSGILLFGSHTHTHVILSRCLPETARQELRLSKELLERKIQAPCALFCYPNGEEGDFNAQTKKALQETGYQCGLTMVEGFNDASSDPYELKRVGASNRADLAEFAMTLGGIKKWISDVKRLLIGPAPAGKTSDPYRCPRP